MLKISICDDDAKDRKQITDNLTAYIAAHSECGIAFDVYSSAFEMLDAFEKIGSPDIALLDICMPGMLGTEVARDILRCSENTDIIFLTNSSDYAIEAFSIHASDYVIKPYTQQKFNETLDRVIGMRQSDRTWILLSSEGELHRIALEDVLYIETIDKLRLFYLLSGKELSTWVTHAKLQEYLSGVKGMVSCGASYVVNLRHVRSFSGSNLEMENGTRIPIPRRLRSQIKQAYFDFYLKEAKNGCLHSKE